jgi:hypothetical protein
MEIDENDLRYAENFVRPGIYSVDFEEYQEDPDIFVDASEPVEVAELTEKINGMAGDWNMSSDSQTKKSCGSKLVNPLTKPKSGHIRGNHMSVLKLMRKPEFIARYLKVIGPATPQSWVVWGYMPGILPGFNQKFLGVTYRAWSGSMRYQIAVCAGHIASLLCKARNEFDTARLEPDTALSTQNEQDDYRGHVIWRPVLCNAQDVQLPFYTQDPTNILGVRN